MNAPIDIHIVTSDEVSHVKALGFEVTQGRISCVELINKEFVGLELQKYLTDIDNLLGPIKASRCFKELVHYENPPEMLIIQYYSEDEEDEEYGLAFSHTFKKEDGKVILELDFLRLPSTARRQGIAKQLLNIIIKQCQKINVSKIRLEAGLANGGLVWAKAGFVATDPDEVTKILQSAEEKLNKQDFNNAKRIYDRYYDQHKNGPSFPIEKWSELPGMKEVLNGSRWSGELNLTDSDILSKFINYVA